MLSRAPTPDIHRVSRLHSRAGRNLRCSICNSPQPFRYGDSTIISPTIISEVPFNAFFFLNRYLGRGVKFKSFLRLKFCCNYSWWNYSQIPHIDFCTAARPASTSFVSLKKVSTLREKIWMKSPSNISSSRALEAPRRRLARRSDCMAGCQLVSLPAAPT